MLAGYNVCSYGAPMFKLVILIEPQKDWLEFTQDWPKFLTLAEKMPGLIKESISPIHSRLKGSFYVSMIHEMFFETMDDLKEAMASPEGVAAGQMLQTITDGKVTLLFAEHLEDDLKNIQSYQITEDSG
jgi:uncharacterized protein (TIGR02118 family)